MNLKVGMLAIFENGEEARITGTTEYPDYISLCFDRGITGYADETAMCWNYRYNGIWIGDGNNIVKTLED